MKKFTFFTFLLVCTLGFSQQSQIKGSGSNNPILYGNQQQPRDIQSPNLNPVSGEREIRLVNGVDNPSVYRNSPAVYGEGISDPSFKSAALQGINQPVVYKRDISSATFIYPMTEQNLQVEISADKLYRSENRSANVSPTYGANRPMADIIPIAGAIETFTPDVGDNFFDPGGPGGSSTGGTPGNYPNCGCATQTTLAGVTEIDFQYFSVFGTFDYLRIYDGTDATGTKLYDNGEGGANAGDITLANMIASNGSSSFVGTSGNFFFYFHASTVVDYGGWDVEIIATGGGGGGTFPEPYCALVYSTVEPITLVEVAGIDNRSSEVINGSPAHEDFTAIVGNMTEGESYAIALEGNTNGGFTCSFTVFIDWNQDGILDNASERYEVGTINSSTGIDGQQATGTITVPAGVTDGPTRMRVMKKFSGHSTDSCTASSWGQAEDYTIMVTAGGGTGDVCSEENPNDGTFENGFNISSASAFKTANDLTVAADEDFTLSNITASIFANGGITNVDVTYYANASGLPGAVIGSETSVTIDSQAVIGSNFGFDVNEVELSVTPFVFSGQEGAETTYWIELSATDGGGTGNVFWVVTSSTSNGYNSAQFDSVWALDVTGMDGVYIWDGECTPMDDDGGDDICSEENPNDGTFENGFNISSASAFKTANDLTVAADEDFTLSNITASIFANGGITNVDVVYYADASGLPGAVIGSQNSVTIDNQTVIGDNFGFDVNEVELSVTPFVFSGQEGVETTYWIELSATDGGGTGNVFWVVTSSTSNGYNSAQFDSVWALDVTGMDGVYIWDGECEPMDTGGGDTCSEENPNDGTFQNGYNISSETAFLVANDLTVAADEDFTLTNITASIFANGGITNIDVVYYADASGLPGAVIGSQNSVTIDNQTVIGENFGFDVNEVELSVAPFVFNGQEGVETKYWIELSATDGGSTGNVFWVVTSSSSVGLPSARFNAGWAIDPDGLDGVYMWEGECEPMDTGGGDTCSEENPNDGTYQNGYNISSETAFLVANDVTVAAGENFTLTNITASIFANGGITNVDVVYYENASGLPGAVIGSQNSVTIDNQTVIGENFGFDVNEVELSVTPFVFSGQAGSDTTYWIELSATDGGSTGNVFWVVTSSTSVGLPSARFNAGWAIDPDGLDGVYIWEGECDALGVADAVLDGFTYYPNPTNGMLNLSADKNIQDISVFNMLGQQVIASKVGATTTEIDFSALAIGTYVMKVTIDGQTGTYKVIRN